MTDFIVKFFEAVSPFMLAFGPLIIVLSGACLFFRIVNQSDEELERGMRYYFDRLYSRYIKRRRRKAYWRLLKYKISKRFSRRESLDLKRDSYLWNYTYRDKR